MSVFDNEKIYCPNCPAVMFVSNGKFIGEPLELKCHYDHDTDIGHCVKCGKDFIISYKVDEVVEFK